MNFPMYMETNIGTVKRTAAELSTRMAVRLSVIRTTAPSSEAAPSSEYFPSADASVWLTQQGYKAV